MNFYKKTASCSSISAVVVVLLLMLCINSCSVAASEDSLPEEKQVAKARVESCSGCSLNRLHEVKKFIFDDLPYFHNVEFKSIGGAKPELLLLNQNGDELERIGLSKLNRDECNKLLESKGFYRKSSLEEEVPEEYKSGPYFPREDL